MRSSVRLWAIAPLLAVFIVAAGVEADTSRQHLYQELQLSEQVPPSSLDLSLYLAISGLGDSIPQASASDATILQGQPLSIRFWVANEGSAPQVAVEDGSPATGRIHVSGLMRGSADQVYLPVTWSSPQLRHGAARTDRHELLLPAGSSVGWIGAVTSAEGLKRGVYQLVVDRTIKDAGGRPARLHTGALTLHVK